MYKKEMQNKLKNETVITIDSLEGYKNPRGQFTEIGKIRGKWNRAVESSSGIEQWVDTNCLIFHMEKKMLVGGISIEAIAHKSKALAG